MNILSIQPEEVVETPEEVKETPPKEKVDLGQVLELAVQSMSVTMETEEEELTQNKETHQPVNNQSTQEIISHSKMTFESTEDQDSDFEWKLENEEESTSHSPPAKKKKLNTSSSFIVPTVSILIPRISLSLMYRMMFYLRLFFTEC